MVRSRWSIRAMRPQVPADMVAGHGGTGHARDFAPAGRWYVLRSRGSDRRAHRARLRGQGDRLATRYLAPDGPHPPRASVWRPWGPLACGGGGDLDVTARIGTVWARLCYYVCHRLRVGARVNGSDPRSPGGHASLGRRDRSPATPRAALGRPKLHHEERWPAERLGGAREPCDERLVDGALQKSANLESRVDRPHHIVGERRLV